MQDSVGGDNNRTPVIFQVLDNCNFVGGIGNVLMKKQGLKWPCYKSLNSPA